MVVYQHNNIQCNEPQIQGEYQAPWEQRRHGKDVRIHLGKDSFQEYDLKQDTRKTRVQLCWFIRKTSNIEKSHRANRESQKSETVLPQCE